MFKILEKNELGPKMFHLKVRAERIAVKAEPGQFVILNLGEKGERFPLTVADFDRKKGTIDLVFQEMGRSTHQLSRLKAGDEIPSVLGPQGMPTEIENFGRVAVIGGGIGIAPVYPLARKLRETSNEVVSIIGYRSSEHVFWEEKMKQASTSLEIATNDGSYGMKGFVTDVLKKLVDEGMKFDHVFAIGPPVMMKAVAEMTAKYSIPTTVSLNSLMVCGMGMCGACRVSVGGKNRFTCMDGPDFDAHQVDFKELFQRLSTYKMEEQESFEMWKKENLGMN